MAEIKKKILTEYYEEIINGHKTFELRLADWECNPGDILILKEVDNNHQYTGREIRKKVGYVLKTKQIKLFEPEEVEHYGYQIISLLDEDKA